MTNEKLAAQHYLKTNILGAYETADIIWQSDSEGTSHRTFADSFVYTDETSHTIERDMVVEDRVFRVHSVFPVRSASTPTKKMLSVIENDLEKALKKLDFSTLVEPVAVCFGYRIQFATTKRRIFI
jgi:hypothetical protein